MHVAARSERLRGVIARDYEGLVAKDETSLYEAGPTGGGEESSL